MPSISGQTPRRRQATPNLWTSTAVEPRHRVRTGRMLGLGRRASDETHPPVDTIELRLLAGE